MYASAYMKRGSNQLFRVIKMSFKVQTAGGENSTRTHTQTYTNYIYVYIIEL